MKRIAVESSALASVGYHMQEKMLEIEFKSGGVYEYYRVPHYKYIQLMNAESHGTYFLRHIRNEYAYKRVKKEEGHPAF